MRLTSKALVLMAATTAFCICHIKYTPECKEEIKLYTKCYEPDREIFYSDECQEFLNNFFDILPKCKKSLPPSFRKCEESRHKAEYAELVLEINRSDEEYNRCPLNMEYGYSVDESDTERLERLLKAAKNSCYSKKCSKAALQYFELMKESKILEKAIDDKREELYDNAIDTLNKCNNGNSGSSSGSSSGKCGKNIGSCPNGKCCSKYGYCGTTDDYCSDTKGCQSEFGVCFSIGEPAVFEYPVSKDGRCGENFGTRCPNDECCSQYGYCGESSKHCGKGCQSEFGDCYSVGEPAVDYPVSEDGRCGENFGTRCPNDECCSQYSYCGESSKHCGKGCQSEFGHCN